MKILLGIACLLLAVCTQPRAPTVGTRDARPGAPTVAIRAVTVVDVMDGSLRGKQAVLVAGNRITAVGPADQARIPHDAALVEGTGGFLIPGLWDMHIHIFDQFNRRPPNAWYFPLFIAARDMDLLTLGPTVNVVKLRRKHGSVFAN
jgi:alpha-D-ribose 1-methylphosphonate 5-triphosphate diphosphatase PhnM